LQLVHIFLKVTSGPLIKTMRRGFLFTYNQRQRWNS